MKRHLLICGERGVGKSTLIRRLLEQYGEGREVHVFHSRAEADDWLRTFPGV